MALPIAPLLKTAIPILLTVPKASSPAFVILFKEDPLLPTGLKTAVSEASISNAGSGIFGSSSFEQALNAHATIVA